MSPRRKPPSYRLHKPSGRAVVTLPDGKGGRKDVYLGQHGSPESRQEYERIIRDWRAPVAPASKYPDLTVNELLLAYFKRHVASWYVDEDGRPTSEQHCIRAAARFLKEAHGFTRAADFGPIALRAVRDAMGLPNVITTTKRDRETGQVRQVQQTNRGLSRNTINGHLSRLKAIFKWAVGEELLDVAVYNRLATVPGLKAGRTMARETTPVTPVSDHVVDATLPELPQVVADMVRVQRLTGCRPGEVVQLRACDLDMSGPVWEFRPRRHKNKHRQRDRIVYIGPRAQEILRSYFSLDLTSPLFRPDESVRLHNEQRSRERKTPQWPSHTSEARRERRADDRGVEPTRLPGKRYTCATYAQAIARACVRAGVPHWAPNQLRHTAATSVRKRYGLEVAQVVLGHAEADVTQIYAELDADAARRVMQEIG